MKSITVILLALIMVNYSLADEGGGEFEIYTHTTGYNPQYNSVYFWLETDDAVWDKDDDIYTLSDQYLTNLFNNAYATYWRDLSVEEIPIPNNGYWYGIFHVLSGYNHHTFGYGIYKMCIGYVRDEPILSFYLDYRDCGYTDHYNMPDIWVKFNASNNTCIISWDDSYYINPTLIVPGNTYKIWEYKDKNQNQNATNTDYFELYLTITNNNNHPHLTWNPYHDLNWVDQYNIYRAYEENGQMTPYHLVASVDDLQLSWTDNGVNLRNPLMGCLKYFYKVNAEDNQENQSLYSNAEYIYGIGPIEKPIINEDQESSEFVSSFKLYGNYPNPFNPTTTISFDLPEERFINLTVYNIYGQGLVRLINNNLEAGSFNVQFNAKNLPSGFYFYKIKAGLFSQIKRMLFIK